MRHSSQGIIVARSCLSRISIRLTTGKNRSACASMMTGFPSGLRDGRRCPWPWESKSGEYHLKTSPGCEEMDQSIVMRMVMNDGEENSDAAELGELARYRQKTESSNTEVSITTMCDRREVRSCERITRHTRQA